MAQVRPISGFKFKVTSDRIPGSIGFSRVSGLESETEVVEYREGGDPLTMRKFRGLVSFPLVTCEKGVTASGRELIDWYQKFVSDMEKGGAGAAYPSYQSKVEISLMDREGTVSKKFVLKKAWPSRLAFEDLDASSSDILIHRLELAHEGFVII